MRLFFSSSTGSCSLPPAPSGGGGAAAGGVPAAGPVLARTELRLLAAIATVIVAMVPLVEGY